MTALLHLRDSIAQAMVLDSRLTALKVSVSVHGGEFRLDDLKRYGKAAPAVVLSLLHVDDQTEQATDQNWADCVFGICCLAKPRPPWDQTLDQHAAVIELVDATMRVIRGNWWDELDVRAPQDLSARNLYTASLDQVGGIAMWAIGFHQLVELKDEDDSVPWLRWHATFDPIPTDPQRPHMEAQGEFEAP